MKRRFRHVTRLGEFREIAQEGDQVVVYFSTDWLGENRKRNEAKTGTFDEEVAKAAERGFSIEVDDAGKPLTVDEGAEVRKVGERVNDDPYGAFTQLRELLPTVKKPGPVLEYLLAALLVIEGDVDEHGAENYDSYFPPVDPDEPSFDALEKYRAHYERLKKQVSKGVMPSAAHLRFEVE